MELSGFFPELIVAASECTAVLCPHSHYENTHESYPRVTAIRVNQPEHKVYVCLEADASSLFPAILGGVVVRGEGDAEVRLASK